MSIGPRCFGVCINKNTEKQNWRELWLRAGFASKMQGFFNDPTPHSSLNAHFPIPLSLDGPRIICDESCFHAQASWSATGRMAEQE